jgi:hypothetical protein
MHGSRRFPPYFSRMKDALGLIGNLGGEGTGNNDRHDAIAAESRLLARIQLPPI